jgi:hypothetical protein
MKSNKKEISAAASMMGKKAGASTLKKYGKEHYQKMAKTGWENRKAKKAK